MNAYSDIAPAMSSRVSVYALARRAREELQMAMELAIDGPHCDVPRAQEHIERARALLGPMQGGGE